MEGIIFTGLLILGCLTAFFYIVMEEKMEKLSKRLTKRQICDYINNHQNKVIVRDKNCEKHKYNAHIARASNGEEIVVIDIDVD